MEVTFGSDHSLTLRSSVSAAAVAAALFVATAVPRTVAPTASSPMPVVSRIKDTTDSNATKNARIDEQRTALLDSLTLTATSQTGTRTLDNGLLLTPPDVDSEDDAWAVLGRLIGTIDSPEDWSSEHDHYLYNTPRSTGTE